MVLFRSAQFMAVMATTALASIILAAVGVMSADAVPQADDGFGDPPTVVERQAHLAAPAGDQVAPMGVGAPGPIVGEAASAARPPVAGSAARPSTASDSWRPPANGPADAAGPDRPDSTTPTPRPVRVKIPAIEVDASIVALGLQPDGSIEVPQDWDLTGWWQDGPEPGEEGPAVILGHVDSTAGPAVFTGLHALQPGDEVIVDREDGSQVRFAVHAGGLYDKDEFPTDLVYRTPTDVPALRLVTCGGRFDGQTRSYQSNYVVFAEMTST